MPKMLKRVEAEDLAASPVSAGPATSAFDPYRTCPSGERRLSAPGAAARASQKQSSLWGDTICKFPAESGRSVTGQNPSCPLARYYARPSTASMCGDGLCRPNTRPIPFVGVPLACLCRQSLIEHQVLCPLPAGRRGPCQARPAGAGRGSL